MQKLGFDCLIQAGAGAAAGFSDEAFEAAGVEVVKTAASLWKAADIVAKVRQPTKAEMKQVLTEIQDGTFARNWVEESRSGRATFRELEQAGFDHPIEKIGKELRAMMPWISAGKESVAEASGGQGME